MAIFAYDLLLCYRTRPCFCNFAFAPPRRCRSLIFLGCFLLNFQFTYFLIDIILRLPQKAPLRFLPQQSCLPENSLPFVVHLLDGPGRTPFFPRPSDWNPKILSVLVISRYRECPLCRTIHEQPPFSSFDFFLQKHALWRLRITREIIPWPSLES